MIKDENGVSFVEICGIIKIRTQKALLFHDGIGEEWVPLSQVEDEETKEGITTLLIPEWLATNKGFL